MNLYLLLLDPFLFDPDSLSLFLDLLSFDPDRLLLYLNLLLLDLNPSFDPDSLLLELFPTFVEGFVGRINGDTDEDRQRGFNEFSLWRRLKKESDFAGH